MFHVTRCSQLTFRTQHGRGLTFSIVGRLLLAQSVSHSDSCWQSWSFQSETLPNTDGS